eukprot:993857-Amphidinium_carterae.1
MPKGTVGVLLNRRMQLPRFSWTNARPPLTGQTSCCMRRLCSPMRPAVGGRMSGVPDCTSIPAQVNESKRAKSRAYHWSVAAGVRPDEVFASAHNGTASAAAHVMTQWSSSHPAPRSFHSKMMMCDVLAEREAQIRLKVVSHAHFRRHV